MTKLLRLCLLWLGLLLFPFSCELSHLSRARKLCGRHLLKEIIKLCGSTDWSQFHFGDSTPLPRLVSRASQNVKAFNPNHFESPQTPFPVWGRVTNPASTSASQEEPINGWETQSLPKYQYKMVGLLPDKIREFSSSYDIDPYVHENEKFQKKSTNKIKVLSSLFWGNHLQRNRRGFSDKCCLKGCTKEELSIACLPYIDF